VTTGRATLVAARPFVDEPAAQRWLREAGEDDVQAALAVLNRVVHLQRIATADPFVRELRREQAICARVGIGEGDLVAEGRWANAIELPPPTARTARSAALRPQERLAALLGARDAALACEELALRARLDLDAGRLREAALQLGIALDAALAELAPWGARGDIAARLDELRALRDGIQAAARAALQGGIDDAAAEHIRHGLQRLEAALRARTALGFD
jgi:hypothetical protein